MKTCRDCGRELTVTEVSTTCLWCFDVRLLAGGFEPSGLAARRSEDELVALREEALARRLCLQADSNLRKEARRRARTERQRRDDGQVTLV